MDIKLNYIEKGKGTPLVLLHGNGGSLECFRSQIDYFSKKYRVIALDTRGHGKSPRGDKPFTIKQFADDLKDFLRTPQKNLKPKFPTPQQKLPAVCRVLSNVQLMTEQIPCLTALWVWSDFSLPWRR